MKTKQNSGAVPCGSNPNRREKQELGWHDPLGPVFLMWMGPPISFGKYLGYKEFQRTRHIRMKEESLRHRRVREVGVEIVDADIDKNSIGKQGEVK